jgi:hypothetical protein
MNQFPVHSGSISYESTVTFRFGFQPSLNNMLFCFFFLRSEKNIIMCWEKNQILSNRALFTRGQSLQWALSFYLPHWKSWYASFPTIDQADWDSEITRTHHLSKPLENIFQWHGAVIIRSSSRNVFLFPHCKDWAPTILAHLLSHFLFFFIRSFPSALKTCFILSLFKKMLWFIWYLS